MQPSEEQWLRLQREAAAGRLAAAANHDLRHLLGGMRAMLEWSRRPDSPGAAQALDHALRYLDQAADLLRVHAEPSGQSVAGRCDVLALIADVERLSQHRRPPRVTWRTTLPAALPEVACEPGACRSILLNLVVNAQAAMATDGGDLHLRAALEADGQVLIQVIDTGPGIPLDRREEVFDAFVGGGTDGHGLGLWSARTLAEGAGGSLTLSETDGGGATFALRLPCAAGGPAPEGRRLLLAEDDALMRDCLAEALATDGWQVEAAADGAELLALLADVEPALVVTDFRMPGMAGEDLLAALRAARPTVPIIVMSGWIGGDVAPILARYSVAGFLAKPFATADLLALCRRSSDG